MTLGASKSPIMRRGRHAHIAAAFEILADGLGPFVDGRMGKYFSEELSWEETAANRMGRANEHGTSDPLFQLLVLRRFWGPVFADYFGTDLRPLIGQLVEARNLWAHLSLPDDTEHLDRIVLSIERLLAPVDPDNLSELRSLRTQLKNPTTETDEPADAPESLDDQKQVAAELEAQLSESEAAFDNLQDSLTTLTQQLESSRRAAAGKQLRISTIEQQLQTLSGTSRDLEGTLQTERRSRHRLEWLFVSFITVLLVMMVLLAGYQ